MARYFFNVRDPRGVVTDEEGSEFAALTDALDEAEASARDLAKQLVDDRQPVADVHIDIVDAAGAVIATLPVLATIENPHIARRRGIVNENVHRGAFSTPIQRAEGEHQRRKLVIASARAVLDARDTDEDRRWALELAALSSEP